MAGRFGERSPLSGRLVRANSNPDNRDVHNEDLFNQPAQYQANQVAAEAGGNDLGKPKKTAGKEGNIAQNSNPDADTTQAENNNTLLRRLQRTRLWIQATRLVHKIDGTLFGYPPLPGNGWPRRMPPGRMI